MSELTDLTDNAVMCLLSTNLDELISSQKYFFSVLLMPHSIFLTVSFHRWTDKRNQTVIMTKRRHFCYLSWKKKVSLSLMRSSSQCHIKHCCFSSPLSDKTESKSESVINKCIFFKLFHISTSQSTLLCLSRSEENVSNAKTELVDSWLNQCFIFKMTIIYEQ